MLDYIVDGFKAGCAALGALCGWFFGEPDGFYSSLIAFTIMDYITGLFAAATRRELCSKIGFHGITKKFTIFILVGVANVLDTQLLRHGAALRLAVIFFYMANEGLSIMENAAEIGLPVPAKLKDMLKQIHSQAHEAAAKSTDAPEKNWGLLLAPEKPKDAAQKQTNPDGGHFHF